MRPQMVWRRIGLVVLANHCHCYAQRLLDDFHTLQKNDDKRLQAHKQKFNEKCHVFFSRNLYHSECLIRGATMMVYQLNTYVDVRMTADGWLAIQPAHCHSSNWPLIAMWLWLSMTMPPTWDISMNRNVIYTPSVCLVVDLEYGATYPGSLWCNCSRLSFDSTPKADPPILADGREQKKRQYIVSGFNSIVFMEWKGVEFSPEIV